MPGYNLVEEKWIPCILGGQHYECGLYEVLVRAHEIGELYDPSPLVTASLHRLLLAILHRNFGPRNLDEWQRLWDAGKWDKKVLDDYFARWHHRFYLFDEQRPFYQVPEIEKAERHPVTRLAQELASGHNATLFDHSYDLAPQPLPASVAARYLVATQAFAIGFGKSRPFYFTDAPLTRGITVLIMGDNLFETLLLNMVPYNEEQPFPVSGQDLPIWEVEHLPQPDKRGSPIKGYLDYLTWQSRAIHLFPEHDYASVKCCQVQQNLRLPDKPYFDPFKCYQRKEKSGWSPLSLREDRVIWRDSHTLLQTTDHRKRPEVISFLARITVEKGSPEVRASDAYRLNVIGMASEAGNAANITLWRHERLPLPLKYLRDQDLLEALKRALEIAEDAGQALDKATYCLARLLIAPYAEKLNKQQEQDAEHLARHLSPASSYWAKLGTLFPQLVVRLAEDSTLDGDAIRYGDKVVPWWAGEVRQSALSAFHSITDSFDRSARALKAATRAERTLLASLDRILGGSKTAHQIRGERR